MSQPRADTPVQRGSAAPLGGPRDRVDDHRRIRAGHDHRAAAEERHTVGQATPQVDTVPDRQPLVGVQLRACRGVDAVGADEHVGPVDYETAGAPVAQLDQHPITLEFEALQDQAGADRVDSEAIPDGAQQQ
ncbi:MAG: hypothetical protein ABR528_07150 [Pseudonocardiaceae bacterium]